MGWSRRFGVLAVAAALAVVPLGASPAASATTGGFLLGVYYGNQGWAMDDVGALEAWQGKHHAVVSLFTNWDGSRRVMDNLFSRQLPAVWGNGNVPLITWEPFTGKKTPADIERRIAAGDYDAYVAEWSGRLAAFLDGPDGAPGTSDDRRAYLRLGHEMNGDWYPWGAALGNDSPADFVAMWRRVHHAFASAGLGPDRLGWIWAVNHEDVGGRPAEAFFPGDAYLDWVAVDGYNWGSSQSWSSWRSPAEILDPMVARLQALSDRPLAITETASTTAGAPGSGVAGKSEWITGLFDYAVSSGARLVTWFNEDKETDWAVFGGSGGDVSVRSGRTRYRAFSAYREAVGRVEAVPADVANPRLLTDAQFAGLLP